MEMRTDHSLPRWIFRWFDRVTGWINDVAMWFIGVAILGVFILLILQVAVRYVLPVPFPWVEEAAVYLSGYVAMVGASVCLRTGYHLQVDLLKDRLPPKAQYILIALQQLFVLAFALFLLRWGADFVKLGWGQESPSSYFQVSYARMAMPIGGFLLALQAIVVGGRALESFVDERRAPPTPPGAAQVADV